MAVVKRVVADPPRLTAALAAAPIQQHKQE
jgi:hypothetical protein